MLLGFFFDKNKEDSESVVLQPIQANDQQLLQNKVLQQKDYRTPIYVIYLESRRKTHEAVERTQGGNLDKTSVCFSVVSRK